MNRISSLLTAAAMALLGNPALSVPMPLSPYSKGMRYRPKKEPTRPRGSLSTQGRRYAIKGVRP